MNLKLSTRPKKALTREAVADAIRQAILSGELVPGQRLVEAELCESLGASRGNVRTALIDLDHEALVERIANRGARVRVVSVQEAVQIAEARLAVESLCVARAAEKITNQQIRELRGLAKQLKERATQNDVVGFADMMHKIFDTYVGIADQPVAQEVLEGLLARNARHHFRLSYRPGRAQVALPLRLELIEAICHRDPDAAREALRRHSENVQKTMKSLANVQQFGVTGIAAPAKRAS